MTSQPSPSYMLYHPLKTFWCKTIGDGRILTIIVPQHENAYGRQELLFTAQEGQSA